MLKALGCMHVLALGRASTSLHSSRPAGRENLIRIVSSIPHPNNMIHESVGANLGGSTSS